MRLLASLATQVVPETLYKTVSISIHDNSSTFDSQVDEFGRANLLPLKWIHSFSYIHNSVNIGYDFNYITSVLSSQGLWSLVFGDDDFFDLTAIDSILAVLDSCSLDSCIMLPTYYLVRQDPPLADDLERVVSRHPLFIKYSSDPLWSVIDLQSLSDLGSIASFTGFLGGIIYPTSAMMSALNSVSGHYCVGLRTKGYIHQCLGLNCVSNHLKTVYISNRPLWFRDATSIVQQVLLTGSVAQRSLIEIDWMYELNCNFAKLNISPRLVRAGNGACLRDAVYMLKMQPFFSKFRLPSLRLFLKVFLYGLMIGSPVESFYALLSLLPWFEAKLIVTRLSNCHVISC